MASTWLFGPLDLNLRYKTDIAKTIREPAWLPKYQPDAYLDAEFAINERAAAVEAARQRAFNHTRSVPSINVGDGSAPSTGSPSTQRRRVSLRGSSIISTSTMQRSEESGLDTSFEARATFDDGMEEDDDDEDDDDDDVEGPMSIPLPPVFHRRSHGMAGRLSGD